MNEPIAHVRKETDGEWAAPHLLKDHLSETARMSAEFASTFASAKWGHLVGIVHDAGKGSPAWQYYIRERSGYDVGAHLENVPGRLDHSTPGAKLGEEACGKGVGRIAAYCVAGHHAGLPDWSGSQGSLSFRLAGSRSSTGDIPSWIRADLSDFQPAPPWKFDNHGPDLSLWIRMLFSCLVDADFLDTESYMAPERTTDRGGYLSVRELLDRFNRYMGVLSKDAPPTPVNDIRSTVLNDCRNAARREPGFFSLTVPTGGGKTLSSMAFGLEHAKAHGKDRVIYVIPYTSILEQNADVFRSALGSDQVVEHHSNIIDEETTAKARLAAENWDARVVVTTSVQFFESMFAARTSRCRKLHNICNSVVVLDEAQLIPVGFLAPILRSLELLVRHYGVTVVICTATQPAFERGPDTAGFPGLEAGTVHEIIRDIPRLYRELRRVRVELPKDLQTPVSWEELADDLSSLPSVLCVVSDRKSCRTLHGLMPEGTYHLSALMCPQHRTEIIERIREELATGLPVRVISTQLVEAGVDLDFPVVYRAMAGLDSIAQAAGRCNREGRLGDQGRLGRVVVFVPPRKAPPGILRKAAETTVRMFGTGVQDPLDSDVFRSFFAELYWKANSLDEKGIIELLTPDSSELRIQFREAAERFKLIDDSQQRSVLVPYGEGADWIERLRKIGPERWLLRRLQRFSVNVYSHDFNRLRNRGSVAEVCPDVFALVSPVEYDEVTGLVVDDEIFDPETYMA